jgi:hypothetical protein
VIEVVVGVLVYVQIARTQEQSRVKIEGDKQSNFTTVGKIPAQILNAEVAYLNVFIDPGWSNGSAQVQLGIAHFNPVPRLGQNGKHVDVPELVAKNGTGIKGVEFIGTGFIKYSPVKTNTQ